MENNKNKFGLEKWSPTILPFKVLIGVAKVFMFGAKKYGKWNYLEKGSSEQIYMDATFRHLTSYITGELNDPESNLPHLDHAITNLMIMRHASLESVLVEDLNKIEVKQIPKNGKPSIND